MKQSRTSILAILISLTSLSSLLAQPQIIDKVIGVVGSDHILLSDVEQQYLQLKMSGQYVGPDVRCEIFNFLLDQKLMMNQARIDSIEVSDGQVEMEVEMRLNYFVDQFGSEKEMEEYFGKNSFDIKDDLMEAMKEQMITQQVRASIVEDVSPTPSDVKSFYRGLARDSIPYINTQVSLEQILIYPSYSEEAVFEVKERLLELRRRVQEGEDFGTLAILYSEGPSATNRGELGFMQRAELDKAYADAAWTLKPGQVSKIVESSFGFHIIQMVERRGERANTRHILMNPKADANARQKAIDQLDSLRTVVQADSLSFDLAAKIYSQDEQTAINGGLLVNPQSQAATFELNELATKDYYMIREMEVGDVSETYETRDHNQKLCYKIVHLKSRTEPHRANLKQDYLLLQNLALQYKQAEVMEEWFMEKRENTYIKIDPKFRHCEDLQK